MTLPGYAAETSLYMPSRPYLMTRNVSEADAHPTLIAQHDPCAMPGGGGGGVPPPPGPCPSGRKCCGSVVNGRCVGQCVPNNARCP
jgi:hypothetical protein